MAGQADFLRRMRFPHLTSSLFRSGSGSVAAIMLRGGAVSLFLAVGGTGLGFVTNLILARLLGPADYGDYAVAISWAMLFGIPATFGMDFVMLRFVPAYVAEGRLSVIGRLLSFSALTIVSLSALIALIFFIIDKLHPGALGPVGPLAVALVVLLMASQAGLTVYSAFFRAIRSIFFSQFYLQIVRTFLLLCTIALLAAIGTITPLSGLAATSATVLLTLLLLGVHLRILMQSLTNTSTAGLPAGEHRRWLEMAWPSLLSASIQQVLMQSGIIALGLFGTPEDAGYYAVASRLAVLITFPLSALSSITAPMIVEAWTNGEKVRLQSIATLNARLSFAAAGSMLLVFVLFGPAILGLFGEGFSASLLPLLILSGGSLVVAFTGACANLLLMTGHQRAVAGTMIVGACVLIVILGVSGRDGLTTWEAASAYAAAISVTNLMQTVLSARWLAINATAL